MSLQSKIVLCSLIFGNALYCVYVRALVVVIPRYERTIDYITSELDESDREDFFRIKRMQQLKAKRIEIALRKKAELLEQLQHEQTDETADGRGGARGRGAGEGRPVVASGAEPAVPNLLDQRDDDILFA